MQGEKDESGYDRKGAENVTKKKNMENAKK
jgi:hypothetical protein